MLNRVRVSTDLLHAQRGYFGAIVNGSNSDFADSGRNRAVDGANVEKHVKPGKYVGRKNL